MDAALRLKIIVNVPIRIFAQLLRDWLVVIIHLVYEGLSVNDNVGRFLDHVLDQGDHVNINLFHEGNIVNGDVTIAPDNVLDQGVHVFIHLFKKVSVSMVLFHSP